MRKIIKWCTFGAISMLLLSGCTKKEAAATSSEAAATTESEAATPSESGQLEINEDNVTLGAKEDKVKLTDYRGIEVTVDPVEITDDQVTTELNAILARNQITTEITDRPAQEGDTVNIDYVGLKDGVAFSGGTSNGYDLLLGSGNFIDGFEDGLIGAETGQKLELNLTFPEQYQSAELAGADVVFQVTVNSIKVIETPELNDEFVKAHAKTAKTVEEYKKEVKQDMIDAAIQAQKKNKTFVYVMNNSEFELTDASVEELYQAEIDNLTMQLAMSGMTLESYLANYQMDEEALKEQMMPEARNYLRQKLIVDAVIEAEGLEVDEQDMDDLAVEIGYESTEAMIAEAGQEEVNNYILTEKVVSFFADNSVEK